MDLIQVGLRFKELLDTKRVSAVQLAKELEVTRETVRLWGDGKSWTFKNLAKICQYFQGTWDGDVEKFLLFGERKAIQLAKENRSIQYLLPIEARMIQAIRRTNKARHQEILIMLEGQALTYPAPIAQVKPIRKKESR